MFSFPDFWIWRVHLLAEQLEELGHVQAENDASALGRECVAFRMAGLALEARGLEHLRGEVAA